MNIDWWEIEDLAKLITGLSEDSADDDVEMALVDTFEISFEMFCKLVKALVPYTVSAEAAISGEKFKGFVSEGSFVIKVPV
ncbi:MAG: hypothetical protein FWD62_05480 [Betaproteobacteria bacterium]|nr:hypothetical protein [Betaproteobacteria bacterium]